MSTFRGALSGGDCHDLLGSFIVSMISLLFIAMRFCRDSYKHVRLQVTNPIMFWFLGTFCSAF